MMKRFLVAVVAMTMTAIALVSTAGAARRIDPQAEEETGTNNLSVPALFVGSVGVGAPLCTPDDDSSGPTGEKGIVLPDGTVDHVDYYVQADDLWQADCDVVVDAVTSAADWGDNLTGSPLKQGTPIRTEIGFLADVTLVDPMAGFAVVKLDPELLDRESHYGTLGEKVADYPEIRVWSPNTTLTIQAVDAAGAPVGVPVYDGAFTAELNSTGRVVYGYNWSNPVAGTYLITVSAPGVSLASTDVGYLLDSDTVELKVTVAAKAGGGGGGGGGGGFGGPRR